MGDEKVVNYAEEPELVRRNRAKGRVLKRIGIVLLIIGLALVAAGVAFILMGNEDMARVEKLSDVAGLDDDNGGGDDPEPNWDALAEVLPVPANMWIRVESRDIDFPVAQWSDNEYGLHHDIYGNAGSWAGVFMDCDVRDTVDGRNLVIYGHTLYGGGMFSGLSQARFQDNFDSIGTVMYATPESGWREYTPICCLDVDAEDVSIREFEFETSESAVNAAVQSTLAQRRSAGKSNVRVVSDGTAGRTVNGKRLVSSTSEINVGYAVQITDADWYELTSEEISAIEKDAGLSSYREWLQSIVARADAARPDAMELASKAEQDVVLACCSWPFHNHRTLVVAVR